MVRNGKLNYTKYFNTRFIKAHKGWYFRGSVHEYLWHTTRREQNRLPDEVFLYQDRTNNDGKTAKRFARDKELLLEDYRKNPTDTRTLFYLAQTCACSKEYGLAYYYYKQRADLAGFKEEIFHSYLRLGDISLKLGHPWENTMGWYMKAIAFSPRAEPLVSIARYYKMNQKWLLAYMFIKQACELVYPEKCVLFVDNNVYEYVRWQEMGVIAYFADHHEEGKAALSKGNNSFKF